MNDWSECAFIEFYQLDTYSNRAAEEDDQASAVDPTPEEPSLEDAFPGRRILPPSSGDSGE